MKRVTVNDARTGALDAQFNLGCAPPTSMLTFQYVVPATTQKVVLVDCAGNSKTFRVKADGTVT